MNIFRRLWGRSTLFLPTILLFIAYLTITSCLSPGRNVTTAKEMQPRVFSKISNNSPRVSLFLTLQDSAGPPLWMKITALEIHSNGVWSPLLEEEIELDAHKIGDGQFFINRINLQTGIYDKIRLNIEKAALWSEKKKSLMGLDKQIFEFQLSSPLILENRDSKSLFFSWDTVKSRKGVALFRPELTVNPQHIALSSGLAFVACPEINTVYIITTNQNRVYGSWGIDGAPTYLRGIKEKNEMYVLAAKKSRIEVVEISSGYIRDEIKIPEITNPDFMALDSDGERAFVSDKVSNYLYIIDLNKRVIDHKINLGEPISFMDYLPENRSVAVSLPYSQKVAFLNPTNLKTIKTVSVGREPAGVLLHENVLYVAVSNENSVASLDLTNNSWQHKYVGLRPMRIVGNGQNIYVSNSLSGSISVIIPQQLNVLKEIRTTGSPIEMSVVANHNWLYVANKKLKGISVVDLTTHKIIQQIKFNAIPQGLSLIQ